MNNIEMQKSIVDATLQNAANIYTKSKATTNAGLILRAIVSIIPVNIIVQMFAHKLSNTN